MGDRGMVGKCIGRWLGVQRDGWTDRWTIEGWADRRTDKWIGEQMDKVGRKTAELGKRMGRRTVR